ncbi:ABATE domain-containing protein [Streptomyces sp. NBC_01005]|uniref:CGNR zinc finger domain-containing protein n=1 Tax=unclassified Streptomyces TaxID=2593676 RepID=UPI002E315DDC|nr:ABATE domain-containing protein [Streptomyces sp. NBC_01362]WSW06052.1 ABATE domain-containing protein [Streptomyces sp. NBC_01005]WTC95556.1 ABATE domain-containing protein [Streptomyces sp. NBC_01650]
MSEPSTGAPGLVLRTREGRPYRFDPGALCLELLPTGGYARYAAYEVLHTPEDLVRWAGESRLPDGLSPVVSAEELARAHELRAALWNLTGDRAHGRALARADLAVVNAAAAEPPLVPRIDPGSGSLAMAPDATGTALLSTVARDAVELFTGPYADRIRECGSDSCKLLFVDTSRPGRRRWCAMEHCGNLHKVRAHRARLATDPETARRPQP